jgi:ABC-type Zn uptake system ZnuABC Zn-binding protein ZnuA
MKDDLHTKLWQTCARFSNLAPPVLAICCCLIILGGCERTGPNQAQRNKLQVATTINIISDWVKAVGADKVNVHSLVSPDSDIHTFEPGAGEVTKLADADVIFAVGLGLEAGWLNSLIENASIESSSIVRLAEYVEPIHWDGHDKDSGHAKHQNAGEHKPGETDPHFWMDPIRVQKAVSEISDVLTLLDPENSEFYSKNANSYNSTIQSLHKWAAIELSKVPESKRYLVTSHESLGYFANRYEFEIIGSLVPALTTEREPTPKEITDLINAINDYQLTVIFTEIAEYSKLGEAISKETGTRIARVNSGSLGRKGSETESYLKLFETIVNTIVEFLA